MMKILCVFATAATIIAAGHTAPRASEPQPSATAQKQQGQTPANLHLEHADVPMYPELALTARVFGTVQVLVTVKDGKVTDTQVRSGPPMLTTATVDNVKTWRFHSSVNTTFTARFVYQLEPASLDVPSNPKIELQLPSLVKITAVPYPLGSKRSPSSTTTTQ